MPPAGGSGKYGAVLISASGGRSGKIDPGDPSAKMWLTSPRRVWSRTMPSFPIVDSHVHLYDPTWLRYGWLGRVPQINRRYDLTDFDRCRGEVQVDKLVFAEVAVDPGLHFAEAAWVQGLADGAPRLEGMIVHAPLEKGAAVEADLDRLAQYRSVRGVRRLIEVETDQSFCLQPAFLEGLRLLPARNLTFDICVKHWGLVLPSSSRGAAPTCDSCWTILASRASVTGWSSPGRASWPSWRCCPTWSASFRA